MTLTGESVLVTGASRGLGLAIARGFAAAGAHVALVARDEAAVTSAAADATAARLDERQTIAAYAADVADEASMRRMVDAWHARVGPTTVLVNNAAIQGPIGAFDEVDWPAWQRTIEIDLIAPALVTRLVLPGMRARGRGKIVNVSGGGATGPRPRFSAYAVAKSGLVRLTETLAVELGGTGIDVNAIAPGAMNTKMLEEVLAAGADTVGAEYAKAKRQQSDGGVQPEDAAKLAVYLGSRASDGITGRLISAVWDPWERLAEHRGDLDGSDIYTLRRIVPADRGKTWGER
jgi:NAD(P)-dependent dehydrogenase (short-subunit alcohol dehydrogenase family)